MRISAKSWCMGWALALGLCGAVLAQADSAATPAASAPAAVVAAPVAVPAPAAPVAAPAITRPGLVPQAHINGADTAWMLVSTALVLLMTLPGIALF